MADPTNSIDEQEFARRLVDGPITLRLYVAGTAQHSSRAVERVKKLCADCLPGRHKLDIIDLYLQPDMARRDQIVALPTLIKIDPPPACRVVGDMTDRERVLVALGIYPDPPPSENHG